MTRSSPLRTTQLLQRMNEGNTAVSAELISHIQGELHKIARVLMAQRGTDHTLQPTALVNEAYLRLVQVDDDSWESRSHFYCVASKVMRGILVDHERTKRAGKRGGDREHVPLDSRVMDPDSRKSIDVLDLHAALDRLAEVDTELVRFVELRFFGGLTVKQISDNLETPVRTVERRLRAATAWLREAMADGEQAD